MFTVLGFFVLVIGILFLFFSLKGVPHALNTLYNYNCAVDFMILALLALSGLLCMVIGKNLIRRRFRKKQT